MKKYLKLFVFFVVLGLMLSTSVVKAEDNGSGMENSGGERPNLFNGELKEKRENFRENMQGSREAFREKIQTERRAFTDDLKTKRGAFMAELKIKKEEWKTARAERKLEFCQKAREMITRRFEFAITQLENYQMKVGEIIARLNEEGKDTTLATESLDLSKQKLADAKAKLAEIKALVPEGGCTNMTPEIFEKIKLGAREAKDLLKESREALHQAIKEVRSLKGEDKEENHESENSNSGTQ